MPAGQARRQVSYGRPTGARIEGLRPAADPETISPVDVVEFRPSPDQYAWTFGGVAPTHRIKPGTALKLWTEDAFSGRLQRTTDRPSEVLNMNEVNPQTGPFHVEGAEPGDTLAIHIVDLTPARDWAASTTIPFFGALTGTDRTALLNDPLPERTWIYQLDRAAGTVRYEAANLSLELPVAPMLGTVGVAPAGREVRSSLVPDMFGGNMDTPEMKAGTTCYLGVNVPGALFSVGDGHYRQGEGESCGTAVEGAMDVTLIVDLVKGEPAPVWPRLEHDEHYAVVGSARPLEDAWRASQVGMIAWLGELYGLDRLDAYQLLTQIALSPLANVCDTNYSALTKISKSLLPAADAYGGMHRQLRDRARSL
jgi:acetamidase/formamidase